MELEEEMVRKIAISVAAVGVFVAFVVGIGTTYDDGGLGFALVGAIVLFILLMAGVGFVLDR
jgi:hypothetical protein